MNILLFFVPSMKTEFVMPLGLLLVGAIIEKSGHNAKIMDLYLNDIDCEGYEKIFKVIENYKPSIIGYGGITTSYGRTKNISMKIKEKYPDIVQIAGGPLSSVSKLLLTNAKIDVVFHGETTISLPVFLEQFEKKKVLHKTPGTSYLMNGQIIRNLPSEQIKNLDEIPYPAYNLVDIPRYLMPISNLLNTYKFGLENNPQYYDILKKIGDEKYLFPVFTSRGCTHRCSFCYRHVLGVKQHSVKYVIQHLKYLKETYHIRGFDFCDELFNSNPKWVLEFCDALLKGNLDIFFRVLGARADKVDKVILTRLKEAGCIMIFYGQESGSDAILKEYKKGVTRQQNKKITLMTKEVGIHTVVQLVIGSPGETTETIHETIQFLKDVEEYQYSLTCLIPFPETPIWEYVEEKGLIKDLEHYLNLVANNSVEAKINLTKVPYKIWKRWEYLIRKELKVHYYRRKKPKLYIFYYLYYNLEYNFIHIIPPNIKKLLKSIFRRN